MVELLERMLQDFLKIEGVKAAAIVDNDGFVVKCVSRDKIDFEALGAMAVASYKSSEELGKLLGFDSLNLSSIEFDEGVVFLSRINENAFLAVVCKGVVVGKVRFEVRRERKKLKAAL